jgi:hypothetical protein
MLPVCPAGVLVWLDDMAAQQVSCTAQPSIGADTRAYHALTLWLSLMGNFLEAGTISESAIVMQPNILRLVQRWLQHPAPNLSEAAAATQPLGITGQGHVVTLIDMLVDTIDFASILCGEVLELQWRQHQTASTPTSAPAQPTISGYSSSSSSTSTSTSSRQRSPSGPALKQVAALVELEVCDGKAHRVCRSAAPAEHSSTQHKALHVMCAWPSIGGSCPSQNFGA